MIYLIGGTARSGKSILANKLAKHFNMSWYPTDMIVRMLQNAIPEFGVDSKTPPQVRMEKLQNFIKSITGYYPDIDKVIEGIDIDPNNIKELRAISNNQLKVCFLSKINISVEEFLSQSKEFGSYNNWLFDQPESTQKEIAGRILDRGLQLKKDCEANNLQFFNTAKIRQVKLSF